MSIPDQPVIGMTSFPPDSTAIVIGATGGIGKALFEALVAGATFTDVLGFSRSGNPPLELTSEASIAEAARQARDRGASIRLIIDATGFLHDADSRPEKSLRDLDADQLAKSFALNAIGPALLMKHFLPLVPREGKAVFATLSARVGSIGDNQLGGWYGYRAAKAALNQLVRTAAVELGRRAPDAICVALHPGTVATELSRPFGSGTHELQTPELAAGRLIGVIDSLDAGSSGEFFDQHGKAVPW